MHPALPTETIFDSVRMRHALANLADPRGKISRMLASGELVSLRRGLYSVRRDIDVISLAGPIYGPSYISFETALAWHGLIPERVTETVSATLKRAAVFRNDFGCFRYVTIPKRAYPIGIERITGSDLPFLIASPTKALADRIAREPGFRSIVEVSRWLEGMRVDPGTALDLGELSQCAERYGRPSVRWLLKHAEKQTKTRS